MKKNNNNNQTIKCDVESCKYNNTDNYECELDEIKVSCNCANDDCTCSEETICDSFEEKEDTSDDDSEYEEESEEIDDEYTDD